MVVTASSVRQQLTNLAYSGGSHKDQADKYRAILDSILLSPSEEAIDALKIFIEAIVNEYVSLVISRQVLSDVSNRLLLLPDEVSMAISHYTLDKIQPRVISFEEQVASIRQHLAKIYERNQNWREAANVLVGIPLETGQKQYTVDYKLETYLKIARLYLEDDDPVQAEAFINRASLLQAESKNEQLQIYYKVCYARVLDYRRKFIEAAQRYNELSYRSIIHEDERMTALRNALICTVLASAGQQRSRMLATLFKDERCQQLPAYSILEKVYLDHLTSPDRNDLLGKKLASPLIPIPTDTGGNNSNLRKDGSSSLITGKRESLDNNPFDNVLHKITEYIQKKDDPFEVILEKAQSEEYNEEPSSKRYSDDNSNRKKKVHYQKLKRHRTLDEFLLTSVLNKKDAITIKASNENIGVNVKKNHILNNDLKSDGAVPTITIENMDSSILSQSGMNDTLFEGNGEQDKIQMKSTLGNMKDNEILSATLKVPKVRRSLSQGDRLSPKKSRYLNCFSLVEPPKVGSINRSNVSNEQQNSVEFLNEGFLKSRSGSSIFSSLSNISSIPKLNSVSSTVSINGSSAIVSDDTMNRSFLGSCSSDKSERLMKTPALNVSTRTSICDLAERLNKIRIRASEMYTSENFVNNKDDTCSPPSSIKESVSLQGNTEKSDVNNKLIDVDLFTSGIKSNNECSNSSTSDTSTDSVFVEGNKINKLIRKEAKYLARTFEEFASKTNSESSVDDLITNSPSWMPELVPAFDDEISVDNLIELPVSPEGNNAKSEEPKVTEHKGNDSLKNKENVRDLEMELVEPIHTEKHLTAATLLLDLKKLIKTENNIEANKLVENLEKTLGVNCVTNTELLTAYLSVTNNLAKSPKKSSSNLEIIKNVGESTMEHSQEDNLTGSSMRSIKESVSFEYVNFNDPDMIKSTDNQKSLNDVNIESNSEIDVGIENVEEIKKANSKIVSEEKSALKMEKNTSINEKLVIELLANIGKLIYAQTEEHPTEDIVTKLRKALQATSRNCNTDNDIESNNAHIEIQQTPKKPKSKFENRSKSLESFNKKTISSTGSITPPQSHKIISSTPNSANKDSIAKKSRSTTPVASSTPDVQDAKKIQSKVATSPKKRNFSYEISPITTRVSVNKAMNNSSRSKLPSPKRTTPKQSKETGIPRSRTPPIRDRLHSLLEFNRNERMHVSPQRTMCKTSKLQKTSPISFKKIETQQSPLKDSNKIAYKVKPMNLISKLQFRAHSVHSFGTNAMEKENNYI